MRLGIVNDTPLAVEAIRRILRLDPAYQEAWVARDGAEAVGRCAADRPDLVLMDLIMPVMDGVEATRRIMAETPCPILVVTATVEGNSSRVFEALGHGALDAVNTPVVAGANTGRHPLLRKLDTIRRLVDSPRGAAAGPLSRELPASPTRGPHLRLLAIGSSTGGPRALGTLLGALPADLPAAVVIVQHIDTQFAPGLARWLDGQTALAVQIASAHAPPRAGQVYLAATEHHLEIATDGTFRYNVEPVSQPYRPSVDVFFESVARNWPQPGSATLLTGMGRDGARGLLALRQAGWHTIAQDQASSVIYGMPRAAVEIGAAVESLPIEAIAATLLQHLSGGRPLRSRGLAESPA